MDRPMTVETYDVLSALFTNIWVGKTGMNVYGALMKQNKCLCDYWKQQTHKWVAKGVKIEGEGPIKIGSFFRCFHSSGSINLFSWPRFRNLSWSKVWIPNWRKSHQFNHFSTLLSHQFQPQYFSHPKNSANSQLHSAIRYSTMHSSICGIPFKNAPKACCEAAKNALLLIFFSLILFYCANQMITVRCGKRNKTMFFLPPNDLIKNKTPRITR